MFLLKFFNIIFSFNRLFIFISSIEIFYLSYCVNWKYKVRKLQPYLAPSEPHKFERCNRSTIMAQCTGDIYLKKLQRSADAKWRHKASSRQRYLFINPHHLFIVMLINY